MGKAEPKAPVIGLDETTYTIDEALQDVVDEDIEAIANQSSVEHELQKDQVLKPVASKRAQSRVLFVTDDASVLEENSLNQTFYVNLSSHFSEIHIIVLAPLPRRRETVRIANNVWAYVTGHKHWWQGALAIKSIASEELVFGSGFRPDVVVSHDLFEGGLGAYLVAETYERPFQFHINKVFWSAEYQAKDPHAKWRKRIARYLLKRAYSVRVQSHDMAEYLKTHFKNITDIAVLPRYYDIESLLKVSDVKPTEQLLFPNYSFIMLYVGKLDHKSTVFRAIDAARPLLRNPGVVLVILGDGPAKAEFMERAKILGIDKQVLFKTPNNDIHNYLLRADILLMTDTNEQSEELVIKAAATGLPLLLAETDLRRDLFEDNSDAFICAPEDTNGFSERLLKFLNNSALRLQFSESAKTIVKSRLHEDPEVFREAYAATIEQVFNIQD